MRTLIAIILSCGLHLAHAQAQPEPVPTPPPAEQAPAPAETPPVALPTEPAANDAATDDSIFAGTATQQTGDAGIAQPVAIDVPPAMEWLRKPQADTVVCPFRGRISYEDGEIECGLIQVPENREVAGSRTIELFYVRLLAKGKDEKGEEVEKKTDPVIYLTGGPGVGTEYYVGRLKDHRVLEQRDLYILEQRGIGNSSKFCPFFGSRNRAAQIKDNFVDQQRVMLEQGRACAEWARGRGVDMRGYNTIENARDVRALRQALGFEQWNVWGISYGSVLGQAVAKVDHDGVKAMVIDAIVPIDIAELMRMPGWYQRDLDKLATACAEQADCNDAYPDLIGRYKAAIQKALDQPFAFEVKKSEQYPDGKAYVFADIVAGLPFSLLYDEKTHAAIPAIIDGLTRAVETRDETLFKAFALSQTLGPVDDSYGAGMSMAIRCQDGYVDHMVRIANDELVKNPLLAEVFIGDPAVTAEMIGACAAAGVPARDPALYAPLQSDLPIVVANGAWDPITPTPLAEYIMPGLSNARLVEFPHAGHGPTRSVKCGGEFLNKFYNDPAAPLDMDCVNDGGKAAEYFAPYYGTSALPRLAIQAAENKKALALHAVWGGVPAALLGIGFFTLLFGWIARKLDKRPRVPGSAVRWLAGLTAFSALLFLAGMAIAAGVTFKVSEAMLLFGFVGWAQWIAWLAPLAGVLGILTVVLAAVGSLQRASRIGFVIIGLSAIALSVFAWYWDLWPF